jgi:hypothetical protein
MLFFPAYCVNKLEVQAAFSPRSAAKKKEKAGIPMPAFSHSVY